MPDFQLLRALDEISDALELADASGADDPTRSPAWRQRRLPGDIDAPRYSLRQVLAAIQEARGPKLEPPKLVVTLPMDVGCSKTWAVAQRLIGSAKRELLVFGFDIREAAWQLIEEQARRGTRVNVVLDPGQHGNLSEILRSGRPDRVPAIWRPVEGEARLMHAKVIVADQARALVGSANFTSSGMALSRAVGSQNWEIGVELEGEVPQRIHSVFEKLKVRKLVERVTSQMLEDEQR